MDLDDLLWKVNALETALEASKNAQEALAREQVSMTLPGLDITDEVRFGPNNGNCLSLMRCVCGRTWGPWRFTLWDTSWPPSRCPECGRNMWCNIDITVWQKVASEGGQTDG